jgi:hypothetical protein
MWPVLSSAYDTGICLRERRRIGRYGESWDRYVMRAMLGRKNLRYLLHSDFQFAAPHVSRCCLSKDYFILQEAISIERESEDINRAWKNM